MVWNMVDLFSCHCLNVHLILYLCFFCCADYNFFGIFLDCLVTTIIFCFIWLLVFMFLVCNRYWVTEMHVDGFRFDLASIMTRASRLLVYTLHSSLCQTSSFSIPNFSCYFWNSLWDAVNVYGSRAEDDLLTTGTPLSSPPLIDMISNDPVLRGVKVHASNIQY